MDLPPADALHAILQFPVQRNIFRHGQVRKNSKVLIDHLDTAVNGIQWFHIFHFFAVNPYTAFVRYMNAGNRLDERRLATTVLARQTVNLTFADLKIDSLKSMYATKGFFNSYQFQEYFICHSFTPLPNIPTQHITGCVGMLHTNLLS